MPHTIPLKGYGPFEAISRKRHGDYIKSRHWSRDRAEKRLAGVQPHHEIIGILDHTNPA